ncbi:hypothetical protein QAD02_001599 [Eretmocerus hayati]|uniref:Uncharacterized protein n=1 Tax=Eretmocerus hayati TaxID=131215 RepID=A0ACC2NGQ4_9HYME|nr:hypothetical protein QAD02_001599 [Eretmocerus hayati]
MFSRIIRHLRTNRSSYQSLGYVVNRSSRKNHQKTRSESLFPKSPFYVAALWGISKRKDDDRSSIAAKDNLIAKADALFDQEEYEEICKLLNDYKDSKDVEILWRLSRALYKLSKLKTKDAEAKQLIYDAYDLISQALAVKEDHWAVHKWVAILLNSKTSYEGTKIKIRELYNIKKHMVRASELNPNDATTLYLIGNWCYQVADLAWYQRKIASAIFGEPPTSSFEEALLYFEKAEQVDPNFYSHNLLMLGKTYLKLDKREDALKYLKMASDYPAKTDDDQEAKLEASKILSSI